jgi:hypothetical protein
MTEPTAAVVNLEALNRIFPAYLELSDPQR